MEKAICLVYKKCCENAYKLYYVISVLFARYKCVPCGSHLYLNFNYYFLITNNKF